ncbi:hypothetical protein LELG_05285 [Lodderomyces elongisporus NRRL YB-4239]|uniref:ER membrane protein complex subunit 10 n=2 Tax=Lodderomyces elongisporus TaxID=36914 RepID=A5E6P6_LODEL|nr:hypothetical protein LELG_05285 [Lodderomyces elongisporus NRRL YB-4239]
MLLIILHLLFVVTMATSKRINLFVQQLNEQTSDSIGFIENDKVHLIDNAIERDTPYCIGTKDLVNHECFAFYKNLETLNIENMVFDMFLGEDGDVSRLSLSFDKEETVKAGKEKEKGKGKELNNIDETNKPRVKKHPFVVAPQPNMNPDSLKKQQQKGQQKSGNTKLEVVKQKKTVKYIDEDGKEVTKEVEIEVEVPLEEDVIVDERSWIQKNWMYVVPPLLLFLVMGGGADEAAAGGGTGGRGG